VVETAKEANEAKAAVAAEATKDAIPEPKQVVAVAAEVKESTEMVESKEVVVETVKEAKEQDKTPVATEVNESKELVESKELEESKEVVVEDPKKADDAKEDGEITASVLPNIKGSASEGKEDSSKVDQNSTPEEELGLPKVVMKEVVVSKEVDQMVRQMLKAVNDRYKNFGKKFSQEQEVIIFNEMVKSFDATSNADKSQFNTQLNAIKKMSNNELNQTLRSYGANEKDMEEHVHSSGGCCTIA
jgi:hypothetical protein